MASQIFCYRLKLYDAFGFDVADCFLEGFVSKVFSFEVRPARRCLASDTIGHNVVFHFKTPV